MLKFLLKLVIALREIGKRILYFFIEGICVKYYYKNENRRYRCHGVRGERLKGSYDNFPQGDESLHGILRRHLGKMDVVVVQCGMGKVHAGICAQILVDDFDVTHIINTGVAGSLSNKLDIGDIVISTDAVQHDFTVEAIGFKKGEIPYTGLVYFKADEALQQKALTAVRVALPNIKAIKGRICTGDQFISSNEAKDRIIKDFDGTCAEMEGAAIAQVCYENHIPYVILRAISDKTDGSAHLSYAEFEKNPQ